MLPSLESLQMKHQNITVQNVLGKLTLKNNISTYSITFDFEASNDNFELSIDVNN